MIEVKLLNGQVMTFSTGVKYDSNATHNIVSIYNSEDERVGLINKDQMMALKVK